METACNLRLLGTAEMYIRLNLPAFAVNFQETSMRNGCSYSTNRDAVAVINELIGRLNEFGDQCNAAQAQGGGAQLDETKFQVGTGQRFFFFCSHLILCGSDVVAVEKNKTSDCGIPLKNAKVSE